MKVGDLVIVASLGEIKAFKANPRTLEAEAGLKLNEVKLDLVKAKKCKRKRPYGVECTFFNAFTSLKFAIVSCYLVSAFF